MLEWITWPVAFSLVGFFVTFFTFLLNAMKNAKPKGDVTADQLDTRLAVIEEQIKSLNTNIVDSENRINDRLNKMDERIDYFIDILIKFFTESN